MSKTTREIVAGFGLQEDAEKESDAFIIGAIEGYHFAGNQQAKGEARFDQKTFRMYAVFACDQETLTEDREYIRGCVAGYNVKWEKKA